MARRMVKTVAESKKQFKEFFTNPTKFKRDFATNTTSTLIRQFPTLNTEFRAVARKELIKRRVAQNRLPFTLRKRRRR